MEDKKLIFFDIDGTLITEGKNPYVPESTTKALELLRANGHICIINTGRPFASLDDLIKSIKVDGYICGCGTYIKIDDEILFSYHLEKDLCTRIIYELDDCNLEWMLEGENAVYYSDKKYSTRVGAIVEGLKNKISNRIHKISETDYKNVQFEKFITVVKKESDLEKLKTHFSEYFTFIDRGNGLFEITPNSCSKATGMKFLENHFAIDHKNTFAVGDSSNDISMLEYAENGILMGDADKSLFKYANHVTTSIFDDGIFNAFKHFELI